ncbi:MAG: hypothetical protein NWE94_01010 [Candidatus Bathyarchaeota archaeon]|nr:hypothetical protein [Candidatus Bathyarchaeota archaeon]
MVVINPVEAAAISYELSIAVNGYGVTSPACGSYYYEEGSEVTVYATDSYSEWGWLFDYWVLDGVKIEKKNNNPLRIVMDRNHELIAEFAQAPIPFPTPEATPSQSPVLEPTATPAATPSPSASTQPHEIPELPSVFILLIFTIVTLLVAVLQFRNRKPYTLFPLCPY